MFEFAGKSSLLLDIMKFFSVSPWRYITARELSGTLDRTVEKVIDRLEQLVEMGLVEKKGDSLYRYNQDEKKIKELQDFIGRDSGTFNY
ncbi:MAG: hypothetical protein M1269_03725 [Chloroflexi bacterium]|nr:hypothetical protein [Chloroflexota bacterium]